LHRDTPYGSWFHKKDFETKKMQDGEEVSPDSLQLDVNDYDVYMNPLIIAETKDKEYAWEYSASFPGIRAMIKRPMAIKVSYLNHEGDEIEEELFDFKAR